MSTHHPMSHADAAWLRMDSATNLMVINSLMWFEATPDWERLRATFIECIVERFPRFRQIASPGGALSGPHWEDDPRFDAHAHFHHIALPAPHDREALRELVSDLATAPLDHERPLWEVHLIDDFGSGAAVLTRVHHAVGDGIALARVMLSATDGGDPGPGIGDHEGDQHGLISLVGQGLGALRHPRRTAEHGLMDAATLAKLLLPGGESSRVLQSQGRVGHRVAWSDPVDLWRVKHIARAYRVTINDVLMAALTGALRTRILAAGLPAERLHALVPLNLRALDEPLPDNLGNHFGLVLAELPVDIDDQVDRLPAAHDLAGRHAGRRRARVGAVLGAHADDREHLQLRRQGDGRLPHGRRRRRRSAAARRRFRAELLSLGRRSKQIEESPR